MMADSLAHQLGNYRILHLLGEGGFAKVYLGEHVYLKTPAALKVPKMRLGQEDLEDFLTEARTSVHLQHPNIVRVLECGVEGGTIPYLVMSYAPGGTLRRRYPKRSRLPVEAIVLYVNQVSSALQYIHDQGLIHQDIKPENMLLGSNNEVMLSDFGIAAVVHRTMTQSIQEVTGTARYMAPEQFRGKARPASDQYALGIVIYEWICGDYPFHGSFPELYSQHLFIPPPPLHDKVPDIPPAVEQVVMKALAKEPQQRFPRVLDLAYALQQATQSQELTYSTIPPTVTDLQVSEDDILTLPSARKAPFNEPSQQVTSGSEQNFANPLQQTSPSQQTGPRPYGNNVQPAPPQLPSQAPFKEPVTASKSRRALSSNKIVLMIGLALLVVVGSVALLSSSLLKGITAPPPTATVSTTGGHSTSSSPPPAYLPMFGYNLDHTRYNPDESILSSANVSKLALSWMKATVSAIYSSPVVANGIVYISSTDHYLYAFDAKTGTLLWKAATTSIDGRPSFIFSTPTVVNGVLYIGSTDHNLYAFTASGCGSASCPPLWAAPTGDSIYSSPAVANGVVYIGSDDHNLYAFTAATGKMLWKATTGDMIVSSPAVDNGVVYVGSFDRKFYAFTAATGKMLWMATTGYKINSSPTVSNGVVYVGSDDGNLYAFNALGCGSLTCPYLWIGPTEKYIYSSPAVANGMVYIGSHDGLLYAFKASGCGSASCSPLWTAMTGGAIESSPAVANGVIYVGSWDHRLYAFNATTGAMLWNYSTGDQITSSSPLVIDGVVYVGSIDHKLYAFSLPLA